MGFWSELKKANPHKSMKRAKELEAANVVDIAPINDPTNSSGEMKNGYLVCAVCRVAIGDVSKGRPYKVIVNKATPLSFADKNDVTVCSGCLETFNIG